MAIMSLSTGCSSTRRTCAPPRAAATAAATPAPRGPAPPPRRPLPPRGGGAGAGGPCPRGSADRGSPGPPRRRPGDGRAGGDPARALAPVGGRVGEAAESDGREIGEEAAAVHDHLADRLAHRGREPEAHARHGGDDNVVGGGEAIHHWQTVGRPLHL